MRMVNYLHIIMPESDAVTTSGDPGDLQLGVMARGHLIGGRA
jgi:hypothetical protein